MTAGGHKKFLFETDFGQDDVVKRSADAPSDVPEDAEDMPMADDAEMDIAPAEDAPPPPSFTQEDLDRAREDGRLQGRDEATRDLAGAMEQRVANALEAMDARIAGLLENYDADMEQHSRDAIAIATVMVRKLFPALNMQHAMAEIEHMIIEAMKRTSGSPSLIVRVPADIHAEVEAKAVQLARARAREGSVNVLSDADMASGNVAVEWDGGGMLRDSAFIWQELDEIIERNLGRTLDDMTASPASDESAPQTNQDVVNPAPVGENEDVSVESQDSVDDASTD